jgi:hypothetical protein
MTIYGKITYTLRLKSPIDADNYIDLPCSSASWRGIYGGRCSLEAVVPGFDYADAISDRSGGELSILRTIGSGDPVEIAAAILQRAVTHEGPKSASINLSAEVSGAFLPSPDPITITHVSYRSDSRTDGSWSYRMPVVMPEILPGSTVVYGDHEFETGEVVINIEPSRETMTLNEVSYAGGTQPDGGGGTESCTMEIALPYSDTHDIQYNCKFTGAEIYYRNFVISAGGPSQQVSVSVSGGLSAQLTSGFGNSAYTSGGEVLPYRLVASGSSFTGDIFDSSYYNIQVRHEGPFEDGMSFGLDVAIVTP